MNRHRTDSLPQPDDRDADRARGPLLRLSGGALVERLRHHSRAHNGFFINTKKRPRS